MVREMKNILGILLIFIISSSALCGDYITDNNQSCIIWDNIPNKDTSVSWAGSISENNFCSGFGLATWYKYGKFQVGYFGTMKNGRFNGLVRSFDLKGHYKKGHWIDGKRSKNWKAIKNSQLKKLAESDIQSLMKIVQSSPENKEQDSNSNKEPNELANSFFNGMAKELGTQTVKSIFSIF